MRKFIATLCVAAAAGLASCTTATGYVPAGYQDNYGFSEMPIEQNRWQVSFAGNSLTDLQTVQTYLLYRAAELTSQQGYDHFVIVDRNIDETTRYQSTGFARHSPFSYQYFHPRFGWSHYHDPFGSRFYNDVDLREVTRYRAISEIIMGRGPKPDDPRAYSAQDVLMTLSPQIQRAPQPY